MAFLHTTWQVLASNYVNVLLVFVPVGIVLGALDINPTAIFIINFLAIVPLAALLSFATEELSVKLGQTIGGLLNATFGNAVELIVSGLVDSNRVYRTNISRSPLLRFRRVKFASYSQVCLVAFFPISCWFLDAASSQAAIDVRSRPSTLQ